jgi:hypothetical protein
MVRMSLPLPSLPLPRWFLGFDMAMEIISGIISLAIGYFSVKGYKATSEKTLLFLNISFSFLGVGLLLDGLISAYVYFLLRPRLPMSPMISPMILRLGSWILFFTEIFAYGLLAYTYASRTLGMTAGVLAAPIIFRDISPPVEIVLIFLLAYLAFQSMVNYNVKRHSRSLSVLIGFTLLLLSHILFLLSTSYPLAYVAAHLAQFAGFFSFLAMLTRVLYSR